MFTGIIESVGTVESIQHEGGNVHLTIATLLDEPVRIDQSIAHDGVCLTVVDIIENSPGVAVRYTVTAIRETLERTNIGTWETGSLVNLERCLRAGARMDGHFVQGHVDATGEVVFIRPADGSWVIGIRYGQDFAGLLVEKGSVCLNGISLTVVDPGPDILTVAIIPYTFAHTNIHTWHTGTRVNLEFDILGKYFLRNLRLRQGV